MSGICGWAGDAEPSVFDAMLNAISYRGDGVDKAIAPGVALGYRWWRGRPGKLPCIHRDGAHLLACAGAFAPSVASPAAALAHRLNDGARDLDGAFAAPLGAWRAATP